jgi:ribosomal protein L23
MHKIISDSLMERLEGLESLKLVLIIANSADEDQLKKAFTKIHEVTIRRIEEKSKVFPVVGQEELELY